MSIISESSISETSYRRWCDMNAAIGYAGEAMFVACEQMLEDGDQRDAMEHWFPINPDQALDFWDSLLLESVWRATGWI